MMPHTSSPRRLSEPFRYPSAQEAEWRMLVAEAAHARDEGWDCAPGMGERAADAGERMLIAEAQAATPASRWALGLGAVCLLILLAIIIIGLVI
jgi:hypothetical protein